MDTSYDQWAREIWSSVTRAPVRPEWLVAAVAWAGKESGWAGAGAHNNAWNSELPWPGSSNFNPQGVQNYDSSATGIAATLHTLHNGKYQAILGAMLSGSASEIEAAITGSRWGTGSFADVLAEVEADYGRFSVSVVPDVPPAPPFDPTVPGMLRELELTTPYMAGGDVAYAQTLLTSHGFRPANSTRPDGDWDGVYGNSTKVAVMNFQHPADLQIDGIVGPLTWKALAEHLPTP